MNKKQVEAAEEKLSALNQENFDLRDKLVPLDEQLGDLASEIGELSGRHAEEMSELTKRHAVEMSELTVKRDAVIKERDDAVSRRTAVKTEYGELYEDVGIAKKELSRKEAK